MMRWRTTVAFVLGAAITASAMLIAFRQKQRRAVLSVRAAEVDNGVIDDCSNVALGYDEEQADYSLVMTWSEEHSEWYATLLRYDSAVLHRYNGKDSNAIVRDACKEIRRDPDWPTLQRLNKVPTRKVAEAGRSTDRYELRDIRNGPIVTTGLLDKQTGRIWIWTKGLAGTMFLEEDMTPQPSDR